MRVVIFALLALFLSGCSAAPMRPTVEEQLAREKQIEVLLGTATLALRANIIERAVSALSLANELRPDDPRITDGFGCVAWRQGDRQRAKLFFQRSIQLEPRYDRGYAHLAAIAESDGNQEAAAELFRRALEINPNNFRARNNRAVLAFNKGDANYAHHEMMKAAYSFEFALQLPGQDGAIPIDPVLAHNLHLAGEKNEE